MIDKFINTSHRIIERLKHRDYNKLKEGSFGLSSNAAKLEYSSFRA
jgi:hypothetical protein